MADKAKTIILNEIGLDRPFVWKGSVHVPGPRVEEKPVDGYRDVFYRLATGEKVKKKDEYWNQVESIAVTTLRDLINDGVWDDEMQSRARSAPMPNLYLPIKTKQLGDGGFIAWIEKSTKSEATSKLKEGICDWVRCGDGAGEDGVSWGSNFEKPVPED